MTDIQTRAVEWARTSVTDLVGPDGDPYRHVGTVTPGDLQDRFPFLRVSVGIGTRTVRSQLATLDFDLFDSDRDRAYHLSEEIQDGLLVPLLRLAGARIDSVVVEEDIRRLPWDGDDTVRFGFTNTLSLRR